MSFSSYYASPPPEPPPGRPSEPARRPVGSRRTLIAIASAATSLVLVLAAVIVFMVLNGSSASALEPVNTPQANPFMPDRGGDDATGLTPPARSSGAVTGNTPGLFGGTNDNRTCDREQMIEFLDSHPDKGEAWAHAVGVDRSEIPAFVRQLSPMILRADTAVTNHGYSGGELTTYPAVLQAGTAVLVDGYGTPRVKCYCGNPLSAPPRYRSEKYEGTRWSRFAPVTVIVINPAPVIVNNYTVINIQRNDYYTYVPPAWTFPKPPSVAVPPDSGSGPTTDTTTTDTTTTDTTSVDLRNGDARYGDPRYTDPRYGGTTTTGTTSSPSTTPTTPTTSTTSTTPTTTSTTPTTTTTKVR